MIIGSVCLSRTSAEAIEGVAPAFALCLGDRKSVFFYEPLNKQTMPQGLEKTSCGCYADIIGWILDGYSALFDTKISTFSSHTP